MKTFLGLSVAVLSLFALAGTARAEVFTVYLSSAQEVPTNSSTGTGRGRIVLDTTTNMITFMITFTGLTSAQTLSHIHSPAPIGTNAGVTVTFGTVGGTSGAISGTASVTATVIGHMRSGQAYVNIHTTGFPGGEIRGQVSKPRPVDFDGDGRSDLAVVRNTSGSTSGQLTWFILNSSDSSQTTQPWGLTSDIVLDRDVMVPEDYDGDGKTDIAVWRPGPPFNAYFYILQSGTNTLRADQFGQTGDNPTVVRDYDGDGKSDPAVFRAGVNSGDQSYWFYRASTGPLMGQIIYNQWGQLGDKIAPGDYDGDGKADFCVQRNAGNGQNIFYLKMSTAGNQNVIFGKPGETIVPGDYDGDGKTDIATIRAVSNLLQWNIRNSSGGLTVIYTFGVLPTEDLAVQGDYDGDGRTDIAVWRSNLDPAMNFFYWRRSLDGSVGVQEWGQQGDYAVGNYNAH